MKTLDFFFLLSTLFLHTHLSGASPPIITKTITVSLKDCADFTKIQDAIDSVPSNNNQWILIRIHAGEYLEKVNVPSDKGFISFEGEGNGQSTVIDWDDHTIDNVKAVTDTGHSATFTSFSDNLVFRELTFKNSYAVLPTKRAVAAMFYGDKNYFYYCSFIGVQDTLSDMQGRHYFEGCYIEGSVDFIFGNAQSIYQSCTIATVNNAEGVGYLTAHGRASEAETTGFVFKNCNLIGSRKIYLGRAWGPFSRVVFYQTYMADVVVPQGWDPWTFTSMESGITYAESECTGPGSNTFGRVTWGNQLNATELQRLTDISFIDQEGWISQYPLLML